MKLTILGTRGEIEEQAPRHSRQSGVLLNNKILFDLGEEEFLKYKPKAVFLTHLHPDHAYFIRAKSREPVTKATFYAPEKYSPNLIFFTHPVCNLRNLIWFFSRT